MMQNHETNFITAIQPRNVRAHIYRIEDSKPPITFEEPYTPLPPTVEFHRVISNVISSLAKNNKQERQSTIEKSSRYLSLPENEAVVSDCFWYAICRFFHTGKYAREEASLEKRIADNYIALTLSVEDKNDNAMFFKEYFDLLSQSVFYAFFYAFPKSRSRFDDELKSQLLKLFSQTFTGIEICNSTQFIKKWSLDLGTGNILHRNRKNQQSQPKIAPASSSLQPRTKKREQLGIRYSPIVELYLRNHDYKTRNYVPEFKMRYTKLDPNRHQVEERFKKLKDESDRILQWAKQQKKQDDETKQQLEKEIKQIKRETMNHNRRLDKRKAQELERGAHEYANYLVSMLNAGITMTSLGIVRRNAG